MILPADINAIKVRHLQALVDDRTREGPEIDFKLTLPERAERELSVAKIVCAFANGMGGDILYGVAEEDGCASDLVGLEGKVDDAELRVGQLVKSAIEPLAYIQVRGLDVGSGRFVLIVRVPRSWNGPHRIPYQRGEDERHIFLVRDGSRKREMTWQELRDGYVGPERLERELETFRESRTARMTARSSPTPYPIPRECLLVHHFVPAAHFLRDRHRYAPTDLERPHVRGCLQNAGFLGDRGINFDGYAASEGGSAGYVQAYRSGALEFCSRTPLGVGMRHQNEHRELCLIPGVVARYLYKWASAAKEIWSVLEVPGPYFSLGAMVGVGGIGWAGGERQFDRPSLLPPPMRSDTLPQDPLEFIRQTLDWYFQAGGLPEAPKHALERASLDSPL